MNAESACQTETISKVYRYKVAVIIGKKYKIYKYLMSVTSRSCHPTGMMLIKTTIMQNIVRTIKRSLKRCTKERTKERRNLYTTQHKCLGYNNVHVFEIPQTA